MECSFHRYAGLLATALVACAAHADYLDDVMACQYGPEPAEVVCPRAKNALDRKLAANPNDVTALSNRGSVNLNMYELQAAMADYDRAVTLDPTNHYNVYWRGIVHFQLEENEAAIADFRRVLMLNPGDEAALEMLQTLGAR